MELFSKIEFIFFSLCGCMCFWIYCRPDQQFLLSLQWLQPEPTVRSLNIACSSQNEWLNHCDVSKRVIHFPCPCASPWAGQPRLFKNPDLFDLLPVIVPFKLFCIKCNLVKREDTCSQQEGYSPTAKSFVTVSRNEMIFCLECVCHHDCWPWVDCQPLVQERGRDTWEEGAGKWMLMSSWYCDF